MFENYQDAMAELVVLALGSIRMLIMLTPLQVIVGGAAPMMLVAALVLALQLPIVTALDMQVAIHLDWIAIVKIVCCESAVGIGLGAMLMGPVHLVESAAALVENQAGANFASMIDPMSATELSPLGTLLARLFMLAFMLNGGMVQLFGLALDSLLVLPPLGHWSLDPPLVAELTAATANYLALTVKLAMPVLLLLLLVDLWLSVGNYFGGGAMQDFVLGFAVKGAVLLLFMGIYAHVMVDEASAVTDATFQSLRTFLRLDR